MSGEGSGGATSGAAVEAALRALAAPGHQDLAPPWVLPQGAIDLIRVAAEDRGHAALLAERFGVEVRRIEDAALHFVHAVMFHPDSDHFRVLGVRPDDDEETLKLHFRWLQKWLHPDRDPEGWVSVYAERVNIAWTQLRRADRRADYRERLASRGPSIVAATPSGFAARPLPAGYDEAARPASPMRVSSRWIRRLPVIVVGGALVLAVGLFAAHRVGEKLLAGERKSPDRAAPAGVAARASSTTAPRPELGPVEPVATEPVSFRATVATVSGPPALTPEPVSEAAAQQAGTGERPPDHAAAAVLAGRSDPQPDDPTTPAPSRSATGNAVANAARAESPTGRAIAMAPPSPLAEPAAGPRTAQPVSTLAVRGDGIVGAESDGSRSADASEPVNAPPARVAKAGVAPGTPDLAAGRAIEGHGRATAPRDEPLRTASRIDPAPASGPAPAAVAGRAGEPAAQPVDARTHVSPVDPLIGRQVLNQFSAAYRDGQVQQVVVLFAPNARTPEGNLVELHRRYGMLFSASSRRSLEFLDVEWRALPNGLEGVGRYEWAMRPRSAGSTQATAGRMRVVIEFVDGRPLIVLLDQRDVG
jgi:hypothetical protein